MTLSPEEKIKHARDLVNGTKYYIIVKHDALLIYRKDGSANKGVFVKRCSTESDLLHSVRKILNIA